jgi:hypothetical protein
VRRESEFAIIITHMRLYNSMPEACQLRYAVNKDTQTSRHSDQFNIYGITDKREVYAPYMYNMRKKHSE